MMRRCHRDIKPENILMNDRVYDDYAINREPEADYQWPNILLTDFGISVEMRPEFKNPQDFTGNGPLVTSHLKRYGK
jgi:serine/threonine protein kinase